MSWGKGKKKRGFRRQKKSKKGKGKRENGTRNRSLRVGRDDVLARQTIKPQLNPKKPNFKPFASQFENITNKKLRNPIKNLLSLTVLTIKL